MGSLSDLVVGTVRGMGVHLVSSIHHYTVTLSNLEYDALKARIAELQSALSKVVDVMRRCDPEYYESHSVPNTTDEEWDAVLEVAEDVLDEAAS